MTTKAAIDETAIVESAAAAETAGTTVADDSRLILVGVEYGLVSLAFLFYCIPGGTSLAKNEGYISHIELKQSTGVLWGSQQLSLVSLGSRPAPRTHRLDPFLKHRRDKLLGARGAHLFFHLLDAQAIFGSHLFLHSQDLLQVLAPFEGRRIFLFANGHKTAWSHVRPITLWRLFVAMVDIHCCMRRAFLNNWSRTFCLLL